MNRRTFLHGTFAALAAAAAAPGALALGPGQKVRIVRLRHGGRWDPHENAALALAEEVRFRTSIDVAFDVPALAPTSTQLKEQAFAVLTGDRDFSFDAAERAALKRWLELGGFLLIDNAGRDAPAPSFDRAARRELERMFPAHPVKRVSAEHVVFRSFYRLDYPAGRAIHKPFVEGLRLGHRYAAVVSHNDLFGALARDQLGSYLHGPTPGGENQREMAIRFGVNLLMYALCLHYKDDQVHLDHLLHRRKWKITPPE